MAASTNLDVIEEDDDTTWIGGVSAISLEYGDGWYDNNLGDNEIEYLVLVVKTTAK